MLPSLCMSQIGAIVLVHRQAKAAFEASDVILKEVRILVEVDSLEGELAETFTAVCIGRRSRGDTSATEFGACTILRALAVRPGRNERGKEFLPDNPSLLVNRNMLVK